MEQTFKEISKKGLSFFKLGPTGLKKTCPSISPHLRELYIPWNKKPQLEVLVAYGIRVRDGSVSPRKYQIRASTVTMAYQAINKTLRLDGKPVETEKGTYEDAIGQLLEGYQRCNPPPVPQLVVPIDVPNTMYLLQQTGRERDKFVGDFCLITFYYLLRVDEYTYHNLSEKRRTQQFCLRDVTLWYYNHRLDPALPEKYLLKMCTAAPLNISNQKHRV